MALTRVALESECDHDFALSPHALALVTRVEGRPQTPSVLRRAQHEVTDGAREDRVLVGNHHQKDGFLP